MVFPVIILDSSFLISFFRPSDTNNADAVNISLGWGEEQMVLPDSVLFETLTVLAYKEGINRANEAYQYFLANKNVAIHYFTEQERLDVLGLFLSQQGKMSAIDVSVIYLAKKRNAGILAFDEQIKKAHKAS